MARAHPVIHRRSLLTGLLAGVCAAAVAPAAMADGPPGMIDAGRRGLDGGREDRTRLLQALLDEAAKTGAAVLIPPGDHRCARLVLPSQTRLVGVGATARLYGPELSLFAQGAASLSIENLAIGSEEAASDGSYAARIEFLDCARLRLSDCRIAGGGNGIALTRCAGRIEDCTVTGAALFGLYSLDATGLFITGNTVADCGNGGILVHRSSFGQDGTLVASNRVLRIAATAGGTGQNGNGINVFRAGGVIVSGNRVEDCAFSAIRSNAGSDIVITGNSCLASGETAIYSEFGFEGAVIQGNLVDGAAIGISIANFNEGGRLASCTGNIVRNLRVKGPYPADAPGFGIGISVEADTVVSNNVVESAPLYGLKLGWGPFLRDVAATGNVLRDCATGIAISAVEGAGAALVSSNIVSGASRGAIVGFRWAAPVTGDLLADPAATPAHVTLFGNRAG